MNNTAVNNNLSTFPAVTQRALETMNTARNAWLEARRQQKAAADNIATIRQRRAEMEATTNTLNEEWRTLFRESQGVVSKEMKTAHGNCADEKRLRILMSCWRLRKAKMHFCRRKLQN